MFYGNILVSHGFRLILSIYQCFIQILTDIRLTAGYFDAVVQRRLDTVQKMIFVDFHLFDHFQNQAVVLMQEVIQQMLLLYFLVAEIVCGLFQVLYSLQRFLCEFTDIHNRGWGVAPVDLWEDLPGGLSGQGGYTYDMNDLKCGMKFVMEIHMP